MATNKTLKAHIVLVDKLTKPLRNMNRKMQGFSRSMAGLQRTITPVIGVAGLVQGSFVALTKSAVDYTKAISIMADRSYISIEQYQKISRYANMVGVSNEELTDTFKDLNKNIGSAIQGDKKFIAILSKMGYSQKEISKGMIDTNEAMYKFADLIASIKSPQEKSKVAMDLLGESGGKLVPMFNEGSKAILKFGKSIKNNIITTDDEKRIKDFTNRMTEMKNSILGSFAKGMSKQMPKITKVVDKFTKFFQSADFGNKLSDIFDKLATALSRINFDTVINGFLKLVDLSIMLFSHIDKIVIFFATVFAVRTVAGIMSVAQSLFGLIGAFKTLIAIAMTSPFIWIPTVIAGVVALIMNWKKIINYLKECGGVFEWLGEVMDKIAQEFTLFVDRVKGVFSWIGNIIGKIADFFGGSDKKEIKITRTDNLNTSDLVSKTENKSTVEVNLKAPQGYTATVESKKTSENIDLSTSVGMSYYGIR